MPLKIQSYLLLLLTGIGLLGQVAPVDSSQRPAEHPLETYLNEIDEMGRTLSGWEGDTVDQGSWFFGSYAMLLLNNNGRGENVPFPGLEKAIPELWSDFKYLTPRYLIELAGGALSQGNLMSIQEKQVFNTLKTEERFILVVAGFGYLRMLQGTIGDSLFNMIVKDAINFSPSPFTIQDELIKGMSKHCCKSLANQFEIALTSSRWCDVNLKQVTTLQDSIILEIENLGLWHFPVDVLVISQGGDSTYYKYGLESVAPLVIPKVDLAKIILDPHHILAEYYRFNNQYPRLKDNIHIQPFGALPDWSSYRITINPSYWSDWDGERRIGLKMTSGFGVDLWPAYPSDYRHRISLELNGHSPYGEAVNWGARLSYAHPLNLDRRLFSQIRVHTYDDWTGFSVGMTRYVGKQTYLVQGPRLTYQRVGLAAEYDAYADSLIWTKDQNIKILKAAYSALSLTRLGDRVYLRTNVAHGRGPLGDFSILKTQLDLAGVFWGWLVGGVQLVAGFQSEATPSPYQFSHSYAWQDRLAGIPAFRGQTKLQRYTNEYLGLSVAGGYWVSGIQLKIFTSSMMVDMNKVGWQKVKPHFASGFGFEHKSFFTAGLYFPIWQSHPLEDEEQWAWRVQTRLTWNL